MQFSASLRCKADCNINIVGEFAMAGSSEVNQTSSVESSDSEWLLLMAARNLKRSIEYSVRQLDSRRVRAETKLRWSRSLTRQVEALIKVAEALNKIGSKSAADLDLSSYLSVLESKIPRRVELKNLCRIVAKHRGSVMKYERG
jgi:hypothetical protein